MRIALIATHHAEYAANLALALAKEHEVMLVLSRRNSRRQLSPEGFATLADALRLEIVPHHLAPLQPYIAWRCNRLIAEFAPDVVHVQEHPTRSMGMLAALLRGRLPLVTTVHDPVPHSGNDARAARPFEKWNGLLRRRSDRLIAHGARMAASLAATGVAPERIAAIDLGVLRFGRLTPAPPVPVADPREMIFFGRMEAYKGLDTLLAANRLWREGGVPIRLLIAGDGPELDVHAEALAAPNISLRRGRVPQEELAALVAGAAAAILPYHDATQSGVVASTFGAGRPVICSDVGGLAEAVGDAGLLVPPRDPVALAAAGRRLVEEPGLLAALTHAARARAEGALGWTDIARRTALLYQEVA